MKKLIENKVSKELLSVVLDINCTDISTDSKHLRRSQVSYS